MTDAFLARRLLGLEPSAQAQIFNFYQAVLEATIENAKKDGKYDDGIVDVSGSSVLLAEEPRTVLTVRPLTSKRPLSSQHRCLTRPQTRSIMLRAAGCGSHSRALGSNVDERSPLQQHSDHRSVVMSRVAELTHAEAPSDGCRTPRPARRRCCTTSRSIAASRGPARRACSPTAASSR